MSDPARTRWLLIVGVRLLGAAGALMGVVLLARAPTWGTKLLGVAIVLSAMWMSASVAGALAHRWRSRD